ncbi:hypothetical protein ACOMHN_049230 [Nucella lapillus]
MNGEEKVFPGVVTDDLGELEKLFGVNVNVFRFDEDDQKVGPCLVPARKSKGRSPSSAALNVVNFANHFCYITDLGRATSSLKCPRCDRLWKKDWTLRRHEKSCTGELVKHRYPRRVYTPPSTPLEILQRNSLNVDTAYVYPYRATYDYEAYFDRDDLPQNPESDNTRYTSRHVPMSLAVSSNVPSKDEPVCFVSEGDPQKLVNGMFDHLEEIAQHTYLLSREEFADVYDELAAMVKEEEEDKGEERVSA